MQFATREDEDLDIFRGFMTSMMEQNLQNEITTYLESIGNEESRDKTQKSREKIAKSREKIVALLSTISTTPSLVSVFSSRESSSAMRQLCSLLIANHLKSTF